MGKEDEGSKEVWRNRNRVGIKGAEMMFEKVDSIMKRVLDELVRNSTLRVIASESAPVLMKRGGKRPKRSVEFFTS